MIEQFTELEKIVVLDFGSQYNQLITRRIREFGVFSELVSHRTTAEDIKAMGNVKGVIFSGGPTASMKTMLSKSIRPFSLWASLYWAFATACN